MGTKEIPELVTEFVAMSKEYLRQETVGRAKLIGRHVDQLPMTPERVWAAMHPTSGEG